MDDADDESEWEEVGEEEEIVDSGDVIPLARFEVLFFF